MKTKLVSSLFVLACVMALSGSTASAAPVGNLNTGICAAGGVAVSLTTIDWLLPAGGGSGCTVTGIGTNVNYVGGGPLVPGVQGQILDITTGTSLPLLDFMTFTGNPNLHFDLGALGPGVGNINCAALAVNGDCSAFVGSPIILTLRQDSDGVFGTDIALGATGFARDLAGQSRWTGRFTSQFVGVTPAQLQAFLLSGVPAPSAANCSVDQTGVRSCANTYSGAFTVTLIPVPEPLSMTLLGLGLIGTAVRVRRRQ